VPLLLTSVLVFLALGGTAVAAGSLARNSVGSAQIKAGAVQSSELHADAVSSGKIKNGTVTGSDVAAGTLGGRELAEGSLTGADLTDGTVTGADLADGSVIGDDLADASVGGRKLAGNSIGIQAIEPLTQRTLIDVPTTQILPTLKEDLSLTLNPKSALQWTVPMDQEGVNLLQAQVSIRVKKAMSVSCEIAVDGVVVTRVHQTVATTGLIADYTTVPLMTTAPLKAGASVAVRCDANQASFASAVLVDSSSDGTKPTTLIATRLAR
jgi:hypothetical protein